MKASPLLQSLLVLLAAALAVTSAAAADAPKYGLAANNKIKAQQLVNQIMTNNPALVASGMHCVAPGTDKQAIIASTLDVIGKPSDPEDILHGNTTIEPSRKAPKLGIMLALRDASGKDIGSLALQFKYQPGDDQVKCFAAATAIRDGVARQIPDLASLFAPIP
jgi:hypothetical protein